MKLYELRRELQDALDDKNNTDEDRELSQADVDRIETRVRSALIRAFLRAGDRRRTRKRR